MMMPRSATPWPMRACRTPPCESARRDTPARTASANRPCPAEKPLHPGPPCATPEERRPPPREPPPPRAEAPSEITMAATSVARSAIRFIVETLPGRARPCRVRGS
jgi:hypothetical protein